MKRTCKKCGWEKSICSFPFSDKKRGYRRHECQACYCDRQRRYYQSRTEEYKGRSTSMKIRIKGMKRSEIMNAPYLVDWIDVDVEELEDTASLLLLIAADPRFDYLEVEKR